MTFTASFYDGGVRTDGVIEAANIEIACVIAERDMRFVEEITLRNSDCTPRTDWTCTISGDHAELSLRGSSQDAQTWAKCEINAVEKGE